MFFGVRPKKCITANRSTVPPRVEGRSCHKRGEPSGMPPEPTWRRIGRSSGARFKLGPWPCIREQTGAILPECWPQKAPRLTDPDGQKKFSQAPAGAMAAGRNRDRTPWPGTMDPGFLALASKLPFFAPNCAFRGQTDCRNREIRSEPGESADASAGTAMRVNQRPFFCRIFCLLRPGHWGLLTALFRKAGRKNRGVA